MKPEELKNKELLPPNGTDLLCRHLIETTYDDLSEDNIRIFKDRLLDMTGCIFGGAIVPEDRFFYDLLKKQGGAPEAPLFAEQRSLRLPLTSAVMHNCCTRVPMTLETWPWWCLTTLSHATLAKPFCQ